MKAKVKNPAGKIFRFTEEALKTDLIEVGERYLCSEIVYENIVMSAGGGTDNQESGIFMKILDDNSVDFKNPIKATTNWWSTEVSLYEECVVGEATINVYTEYNVLNSDNQTFNKITTTKPSITDSVLQAIDEAIKNDDEDEAYQPSNIEQYFESLIGKRTTKEESDKLTRMVNSFLEPEDKSFTTTELNKIFVTSPLTFKYITYLSESEDMKRYNKENLNDLRKYLDNKELDIFVTEQFDFSVRDKQIENAKKVIKDYDMPNEFNDFVENVLSKNSTLYLESFDGTISDTLPRGILYDMSEDLAAERY